MISPVLLLTIVVLTLLWFCIGTWAVVVSRLRQRIDVIPYEPQPQVPWGPAELAAIIVSFILCHVAARWMWTEDWSDAAKLASIFTANVLSSVVAVVVVRRWTGASWTSLGLPVRWLSDTRLGLLGFAAVTPPAIALQAALKVLVPENHPIEDWLTKAGTPNLWLVSIVSAVIVAPLSEELFFRGLLQPWLEKVLTPTTETPEPAATDETVAPRPPLGARRAIVATSAIFAAVHIGQGPAPIPLFFVALVLGWIYSRTHRLWPCVVLHAALNGFSLLALWMQQHATTGSP